MTDASIRNLSNVIPEHHNVCNISGTFNLLSSYSFEFYVAFVEIISP